MNALTTALGIVVLSLATAIVVVKGVDFIRTGELASHSKECSSSVN